MRIADVENLGRIADAAASGHVMPPRPVIWSLATLTDGVVPAVSASECITEDGSTEWHVVALTAERLVVVEAVAPSENWKLEPRQVTNPDGMRLSSSAHPRAAVTRLELTDVTHAGAWPEDHDSWATRWVIHLDGVTVAVPSTGRPENDPGERIAMDLLASMQ